MIRAEVVADSIRKNIVYLSGKSGTEIIPVIKGNAYGHGIVTVAKILRSLKIKYIAVATAEEAIHLREEGGDRGRILCWLYTACSDELRRAIELDIDIAIFDDSSVHHFKKAAAAAANKRRVRLTLFVDTGMNTAGVPYHKAIDVCKLLTTQEGQAKSGIEIVGLMSHMISSHKPNCRVVEQQLHKFRLLRRKLEEEEGIKPAFVHIANTGGCLNYDVSDFSHSRAGKGIFGIHPDFRMLNTRRRMVVGGGLLHLAMSVHSYIIQVKACEGAFVGYKRGKATRKRCPPSRSVAIVPCGFGDIIPVQFEGHHVFIHGREKRRVLAVCMDQMVVEAKRGDKVGDEIHLFGNHCPQSLYDFAKVAKVHPTELLARMGRRIKTRVVVVDDGPGS